MEIVTQIFPLLNKWPHGAVKGIQLGTTRLQVQSLASLSGLRIQYCQELRCSLKMQLRSDVAVAGSCSSNLTPSLGTSICHGCGPKSYVYLSLCIRTMKQVWDKVFHFLENLYSLFVKH